MEKNKSGKYFKYAIGEIILVVIGILIAVSINGVHNDVQNEKKIQAILVQIQNELLIDIKDAQRIFRVFIRKDSLARNVLNDRVTTADFEANDNVVYFRLNYVSFSNMKTGYEQLMRNIENMPERYKVLLPYFNDLFREQQNEIDDYNEEIKNTVFTSMRQTFETVPDNYKIFIGDVSEEERQAILSDPYLKNKTIKFILDLGNCSTAANEYRATSILLYKKIDALLGVETATDNPLLITNPPKEKIESFLGNYKSVTDGPDATNLTISFVDNQLVMNVSEDEPIILHWDGGDYYYEFRESGVFKLYINDNNQHAIDYSNGLKKWVNIKVVDL